MNLKHFLPKMPLKPPWPPQLPESSPESSQRASESLPDASQMPPSRCLLQDASFQRVKKILFGFSCKGYSRI